MLLKKRKEGFSIKITASYLLDFCAPKRCPWCGRFVYGNSVNSGWCKECWEKLPWIQPPFCDVCGVPIRGTMCQNCMTKTPPFYKLRSVCLYEGVIAKSIINLKFYHKLNLVKPLISLLCRGIKDFYKNDKIDVVVPVPLHPKRLAERGFNQSLLIGKGLAKEMGITLLKNVVKRTRYTIPQVKLSGKERRKNLKNVFEIPQKKIHRIKNKSVLIVDDVVTTGTTIVEIAKVIKKAGAKETMAITVARAI